MTFNHAHLLNKIPVIHSLPCGVALMKTVLCDYPIENPYKCVLYKRGLNDTYVVDSERTKYILRVYRRGWRTKSAIDFELELLSFLRQHNLPIAYPIARKNGDFTTAIAAPEGLRYVAVFSYAQGTATNHNLDCEQSQHLGAVVANIHQATDNFVSSFSRAELSYAYLLDWAMEAIAPLFEHRTNDIARLYEQVTQIKAQLLHLALPKTSSTYGICIGDVHSGNAHFDQHKQPTLFDFDQCGYGWRAFDIAKFMHTTYVWKLDNQIRDSFWQGYQNVRKLSQAEVESISLFTKVAHIWVMGISCAVVEDVLAYGWFTDEWFDVKLALLSELS